MTDFTVADAARFLVDWNDKAEAYLRQNMEGIRFPDEDGWENLYVRTADIELFLANMTAAKRWLRVVAVAVEQWELKP